MASRPLTVEVEGLKELRQALKQVDNPGLPNALKAANLEAAKIVAAAARAEAPVGPTGRLQRSIKPLGSQQSGRVKVGTAKVDYASAVHWGRKIGWVGGGGPHSLAGLGKTQSQIYRRRYASVQGKKGHYGPNPIRPNMFALRAMRRMRGRVLETYDDAIHDLLNRTVGRTK